MLTVLVKMMLAQAQESVFEKVCLPGIQNEFFMLVKVAQEAAKVKASEFLWLLGGQDLLVRVARRGGGWGLSSTT